MKNNKMTKCKSCGHEISSKGKVTCPSCGMVNKKPFYKKGWFIVLCILILIGTISNSGSKDNTSTAVVNNDNEKVVVEEKVEVIPEEVVEVKEPMVLTVDTLMNDLKNNALKASKIIKINTLK